MHVTPDQTASTGADITGPEFQPGNANQTHSAVWVSVGVAIGVLLLHLSWSSSAFQYDDLHSIVGNPHIRSLSNIPRFFVRSDMFSEHSWGGMYRPLVLVSHTLNHHLGGYEPCGYGWLNVAAHGLNSGLVVLLFTCLGWSRKPAALAGVLFGLLPVNAEVVNYISSRSESLCACLYLTSLIAYIRGHATGGSRLGWWVASIAAFVGALLAKEVAVTVPGILLAYELLRPDGWPTPTPREVARRQWPYWTVAVAYLVLMREHVLTATVGEPVRTAVSQLATQIKAWVYYLKLLSLPSHLSVEHQFRLSDTFLQVSVLTSVAFLLCGLVILARSIRRRSATLFWCCWFGILLLPTSLVPLNVLVNEHRLYLPSIAFVALVVGVLGRMWRRVPTASLVAIAALVLTHAVLTAQRSAAWSSPDALWGDALAKAPGMPRPHLFMGDWHKETGNHQQALAEYQAALEVHPEVLSPGDRLTIHNNTGATYLAMGHFVEAVREYQKALAIDSTFARARDALDGLVAVVDSERDEGAERLHKEGLLLLVGGGVEEAISRLEASLSLQSWPQTWLSLGMAHERVERWEGAEQAYRALELAGAGTPYAVTARQRLRELGQAE